MTERKFKLGDRVTKTKGSSWTGRVVGFYSTDLTPIGYAVESETEKGSVQIYPEAALVGAPDDETLPRYTTKRLHYEIDRARRHAFLEAVELIEQGYDRGIKRKQDTCAHGKYGWEDCDRCAAAALRREGATR